MVNARRPAGCLLGVDVGSSSTKGVLASLDGELLSTAEREHRVSMPNPGWAEHDVEKVWWDGIVSVVRELLSGQAARSVPGDLEVEVLALGVSGIGPCLAVADAAGHPLRPAILYGVDTRATAEIAEMNDLLGPEAVFERCGSPITTQAIGPKLAWLAHHEPGTYARAAKWFMAHSLALWRLTGSYVLDHHSASQSVPLYDRSAQSWATDWAAEIAPGIELPELAWPAEVVGRVSAAAAEETGLAPGTPVCAGTIDAWSEAVSVGADRPGMTMIMYGTTMFFVATMDAPTSHRSMWGPLGVWPGSWCLAGGMATSGAVTGWFREVVGGTSYSELTEQAAQVPAGSNGLVVLPYFAGERTPIFDPEARGVIAGLTLGHGRGELYRALLEATAYGARHNLETIPAPNLAASHVVAVGGGTKGGLWAQIVSDVTGVEQIIRRHSIGAAYGDAFLAGVAAGLVDPQDSWNPTERVVVPEPSTRSLYDELYGVYRSLYTSTAEEVHALARVQQRQPAPGVRRSGR
ncbi:MAG: FGGY-family carbohydrate kinase [Acidimicrobiales bacterium]